MEPIAGPIHFNEEQMSATQTNGGRLQARCST